VNRAAKYTGAAVLAVIVTTGVVKVLVDLVEDPWLMLMNVAIVVMAYIVMVLLIITHQRRRREDKALLGLLGDTTAEELLARLKELLEEQRNLSHDIGDSLEKRIMEMRRVMKEAGRIQEKVGPPPEPVPNFLSARAAGGQAELPNPTSRTEVENLLGSLRQTVPAGPTLRELTAEDKRQRVYTCADAGMSVNQIARETTIGKGEIKLILSLRRGR
jgi:hypothetical protein